MIKLEEYDKLAEIYKMFSSTSRLKILLQLSECECSVSELCDKCNLSQSAMSHQLKDLRQCKIVKARKDGMNVYYSLDDHHIVEIIKSGLEHIRGEKCNEL